MDWGKLAKVLGQVVIAIGAVIAIIDASQRPKLK